MILALTSDVYDRGAMYDAASTIIQQRLSQIQGVGQVSVGGSSLPAVRVEINPTQLNSYGLGLQDVATMLSKQNANLPKGQISDATGTADIITNDQLLKADNYKSLVVGYHNGAAVKISDFADVQDSVENIRAAGYVNGKPGILLIIFRQPGANIIDTVDRIRESIPSLEGLHSGRHGFHHHARPYHHHSGVRQRCGAHTRHIRQPRNSCGLSISAQRARYSHPQRGRPSLVNRHVRGHVLVQVQHRQPVHDGSHYRHRLRRG